MRIGLAQIRSESGPIDRNLDHHLALLQELSPGTADLVVFPELSLTNYEPSVAAATAITPEDARLAVLQRFADTAGVAVAVGAPLKAAGKPTIGMLAFVPGRDMVVVRKQHLHPDEIPFFSTDDGKPGVLELPDRVGVAICYELSVAAHVTSVMAQRPAVYLATVAKTPGGVAAAQTTLAETARQYRIPVLMVNSVGTCEGKPAGGSSLALDRNGHLLGQLSGADEGMLLVDTMRGVATPVAGPGAASA